jgi:outer membrane protein W
MNTKSLIAFSFAVAAVASSPAVMAQEATPDTWISAAASTKTRADVTAEFLAARQNGGLRYARAGYIESSASTLQRDAVRAEAVAALRSGEIARINAEVPALNSPARLVPTERTLVAGQNR